MKKVAYVYANSSNTNSVKIETYYCENILNKSEEIKFEDQ